jgi:uncharacterized repeat protein (TIGR01451 family)
VTPLPTITDTVTIDGATQPGYTNVPVVEISGASMVTNLANGLLIAASNCTVRALAINRFRGDGYANGDGIQITNGAGSKVVGCYLGIARDGVTAAGNQGAGVRIGHPYYYSAPITSNNVVGDGTLAGRNLISGNFYGIYAVTSVSNSIQGNYVGVDVSGTFAVGNTNTGIYLNNETFTLVGGTNTAQRNLISGNGRGYYYGAGDGVLIASGNTNAVFGNYIGVNVTGTAAIPNGEHGVNVQFGDGNLVGGAAAGQGNLISGNLVHGVNLGIYNNSFVYSGTPKPRDYGTVVQGNRIGTDVTGLLPLPNSSDGVYVNSMAGNLIGGFLPGEGNLIAFNTNNGVEIFSGSFNLANDNEVAGNVITANRDTGVLVNYSITGTAILSNSIYANTNLGIDLDNGGVTLNDLGDGDTGANNLQNFPVLGFPLRFATTTVISGTLNSATNQIFRIEIFDNDNPNPQGYGEGQRFLTALSVTNDSNGNSSFIFTNPVALPFSHWITATATDTNSNTSEFSFARQVVDPNSCDLAVTLAGATNPAPKISPFTYTITVTNNGPGNATGVTVTNPLPVGLVFVSATTSQGSTAFSGGALRVNVGTLAIGAGAVITLTVNATNTAIITDTVSAGSSLVENYFPNNTASLATQFGIADLAVGISDTPDPVVAGQPVTYTIFATNLGPDTASSATLTFTADNNNNNSVVTGASVSQGTLSVSGGVVSCALGNLPVNSHVTLTVTAVPTESGTFDNTADASAAESDPNSGNSSATETTTVTNGPGVIQFKQSLYTVVEAAGASVLVGVQRTGGAIGTVTANFSTANLTAIAGVDYVATNGTLTFTNTETFKTFRVAILDDGGTDCNERLQLRLTNPTGGVVLIGRTNVPLQIFENHAVPAGVVQAVSVANTNLLTTGNGASQSPSVSDDGRYVAFNSYANNLVATPDFNNTSDVFIRDRATGANTLVSLNVSNTAAGNGYSTSPKISADGRAVAFFANATDLTTNQNPFSYNTQLFARNLLTGSNYLVSVNTNGAAANNGISIFAGSSNGTKFAFSTVATDLVPNDNNGNPDVFFRDLASNTVSLVSVNAAGTGSANGYSGFPAISANGRYVAFLSYANNLLAADNNTRADVYRRDVVAGTSQLVSATAGGAAGNNSCGSDILINGDGRYIAFESYDTDIAPGASGFYQQIFLRDLVGGTNALVSVNNSNVIANNDCTLRGLSRDGRYVLFESQANNLFTNDNNSRNDLFVRDTVANVTTLVNINLAGTAPGNDYEDSAPSSSALSSNGRYVSFSSAATDLVAAGKQAGIFDAFVRDLQTGVTTLLSTTFGGSTGAGANTSETAVSANGVGVFGTYAADIAQVDANFSEDIFARTNGASAPELISQGAGVTGNGYVSEQQITADGTKVAFASGALNLVANDTNGVNDIFLYDLNAHTMKLISVNTNNNGSQAGTSDSARPSADGRFVAYHNYVQSMPGFHQSPQFSFTSAFGQIFLRDSVSNVTTLISVNTANTAPGNNDSTYPQITPSGQFVVFESIATDLVTNDVNGVTSDIFIRNRTNAVCELVSFNVLNTASANNESRAPSVSADGRFVGFGSLAKNISPFDSNNQYDVYVRDRQIGSNVLCSLNLAGNNGGNGDSFGALVSSNGAKVVFVSYASDLVAGGNANENVYAFDTAARTLALVSKSTAGIVGNDNSAQPSVSADGRYVAFASAATNLVTGDNNGWSDIFVRDLVAGTTTLVSVNCQASGGGNEDSDVPQISANGRYVSFHSYATDLVPGNFSNDSGSIFRRDLVAGTTVLVSQNLSLNGEGNANSPSSTISASGAAVSFLSSASDLILGDVNGADDAFAWIAPGVPAIDLAITKTASAASVAQGGALSYTLTVTNYGIINASSVVVTDALPASVTFVSATTSQGTFNNNAGLFTANLGTVNLGSGASITINVTANTIGSVTNTATTRAAQTDPNLGNNSATVIVAVTGASAPQLTAQSTNTSQLFLKWPYPSSGYTLQTATNLLPVIVWSPVTNTVSNNGLVNYLLLNVNAAERTRFFRLYHP